MKKKNSMHWQTKTSGIMSVGHASSSPIFGGGGGGSFIEQNKNKRLAATRDIIRTHLVSKTSRDGTVTP